MKGKKIIGLVLGTVLIASAMAGCGKAKDAPAEPKEATEEKVDEEKTETKESTGEKVKLTVWGDTDNQAIVEEVFTEANELFMEQNPNIELDYQYSGNFDSINVAIQSDTLPDLFWVQGNKSTKMAEMARNGFLLPLDSYNLDNSRFPEDAIEYAMVDGSVYCSYPAFFDYAIQYYNVEIFEKYNLEKPKTWDDFKEILKVLVENGETPIAFGGNGDFDRYWLIQTMAPALANDTMDAIKDNEDVDFSNLELMFDEYRNFAESGYYGKDFQGIDGAGAQLAFTNKNAAMIIDGTWNNNMYKELPFEIGRFAMPGTDGQRYAQSGASNFTTYAVSAKTEHPDEAAKYVEFLNSAECQQIFENHLGSIPMVKDLEVTEKSVEEMADFEIVGNNIYHVLSGVSDDNGKPQDIFLSDVLPQLMTSKITGKEAIEKIQAEMDKVAK